MIDRNAMALYVKVVENRSFSETARREDVPVSTVSRKIAELENALGVKLLERSTRQLRVTDIGRDYYEHCRRGLEEFDMANLLVNNRQREVSGTLRISVPPNLSDVIVAPLITAFRKHYPNVLFRILVADRNMHLIEDGIDLALRVGELADSSMVARPALRYRHLLVASPEYLARAGQPSRPDELRDHPLITFSHWFVEPRWALTNGEVVEEILINPRFSINEYNGIQRAVLDGHGIGEIPSIICRGQLETGELIEVMTDWRFNPVTLSIVYSSRQHLSRLVSLFKDFCIKYMAEQLPEIAL